VEEPGDALLYVSPDSLPDASLPLIVMLHGAGGNARSGLSLLLPQENNADFILLAPSSKDRTWDLLVEGYGRDVRALDRVLDQVFQQYHVDNRHVAIGGFSDGASYALSLGLGNGDLFTHIIAFSPGFVAPDIRVEMPKIFLSHGKRDSVLPIEHCGRKIARELQRENYDIFYREFDGPHTVPPSIARDSVMWFIA
jgi:phospholipase/carboxylesterase